MLPFLRWLSGRGASERQVRQTHAAIPEADWRALIRAYPFLTGLTAEEDSHLRQRVAWLLASKTFTGVQGQVVDDQVRLAIATQAALPILQLAPTLYEGWQEIIVYPTGFVIPRSEVDEDGVVHEYVQEASGEAWEGGPVVLSWSDVAPGDDANDMNVVIHEFAHKLDLADGDADGIPSLAHHPELSIRHWHGVLTSAYAGFVEALDRVEAAIPRHIDPESEAASPWYQQLPLDPYAGTDPAEFFAVSSETFFIDPLRLRDGLPAWYELLVRYYRQDPAQRQLAALQAARLTAG